MLLNKSLNKFIIILLIFFINISNIFAENLLEIYYLAVDNDPTVLAAKQSYLAEAEQVVGSRSKILPNAFFSGSQNRGQISSKVGGLEQFKYDSKQYSLNIMQPIFHAVNWLNYAATKKQTLSSLKKYEDIEQKLILRVAEQYFAVLAAIDQLATSKAIKESFAKRLEQAAKQLKVGVIAVTDLNDAQARLDIARAKEIADINALRTAKENLMQIVGKFIDNIFLLKKQMPLIPPNPENIEAWLEKARKYNIKLQAARLDVVAARELARASACGHLPTINLRGSVSKNKNPPSSKAVPQERTKTKEIAASLELPIFSGGSVIANTQAAIFKTNAAMHQLEAAYRDAESSVRIAYNTILTQISQIEALQQSVKSSQIALKATQAAYTVGTRTIVDVLNAQSDILNVQKDYAHARYGYIMSALKLKQATGALSVIDLEQINTYLEAEKSE